MESGLLGSAGSGSLTRSSSQISDMMDLTLQDTQESLGEGSDTESTLPPSPTARSRSSSSHLSTAPTAITVSVSPQTSVSMDLGEMTYKDLSPGETLPIHPSEIKAKPTPQAIGKRTRAAKRMSNQPDQVKQRPSSPLLSQTQPPAPKRQKQKKSSKKPTKYSKVAKHTTKSDSGSTKGSPAQKLEENKPKLLAGVVSIGGDEYALKPPVDPLNLPDEWSCNECRIKSHPPEPSSPSIFQQLLDNINQSDPQTFELPQEIRSYFRGVETSGDGAYVETVDYKPLESNTRMQSVWENALELTDKKGDIRLCYRCSKSACGGRWMINCEHCPLHWHLDCLSPPLASPPASTRKWMCPNHADHVQPRHRKRRGASPIEVLDHLAPNDGDIEVVEEGLSSLSPITTTKKRKTGQAQPQGKCKELNPDGPEYRVSEANIRLSFTAKCRRLKSILPLTSPLPPRQGPPPPQSDESTCEGQGEVDALEMLVLAATRAASE
ncbi:hypothetical protein BGX23_008686 [Mortierella sp. AD031]|nr:hypothetical protein BGX23_008686 [Mortierella sp. AD031]